MSIAADAIIFNRQILARRLAGSGNVSSRSSAEDLILAAYDKWAEDCPLYLSGEYSFAIWDANRGILFCCRDRVASRPFFYWHSGVRFVFATDPELILTTPGVPRRPNLRKIALMAVRGGSTALPDESFHEGIYGVPAGCSIRVSREGLRKILYWTPKVIPSLVPPNEDEAIEALRHLLIKAVDDRIGSVDTVGGLLSGGLDSSSVIAMASRSLLKSNREISTFAHVLPEDGKGGAGDEREFIESFRDWPNVRINYVIPPPEAGPFSALSDPTRYRRTFFRGSHIYVYDTIQQMAQATGAQLILDGGGGELGPTADGRFYLMELVVSGKWFTLKKQLRSLKSVEGVYPFRELAGNLLSLLFPRRRQNPFLVLNPHFVRAYDTRFHSDRPWPSHRRVQAKMMLKFFQGRTTSISQGPIPYCLPLVDPDLLEFCLAAPGSMKINEGFRRLLIRHALDGILPSRVQWRTDKMRFAVDYFARYNAHLNNAREWLAQVRPNGTVGEVVDLGRLRELMTPYPEGARPFRYYAQIPVTLYLVSFLQQFAEFQR